MAPVGVGWRPEMVPLSSLSAEEYEALGHSFTDVQERLTAVLQGGHCLAGFVLDVAGLQLRRIVSSHSIIDAVARLEGDLGRNTATKAPTRYSGPVLNGLWHAHFADARFVAQNLKIENSLKRVREIMAPHFGKEVREVVHLLAHEMTMESYKRRAKRRALTGECMVFEGEPNQPNIYLTVRWHGEDDAEVMDRITEYRSFQPQSDMA